MILFIDDDNVDGGGAASRSVSFIGMRWGSLGSLHALWRPFLVNDLWPRRLMNYYDSYLVWDVC